jgi:5-methylcytosine-specific restriction enzyme A
MSVIEELKPSRQARVIDLVAAAGHDVSDWKNFMGGVRKEASNPKYCYEWTFVQPHKAVVLNLWHEDLREVSGKVVQQLNYRQHAKNLPQIAARGTWAKRAKAMDEAFAFAYARSVPVRVIVCDGERRDVIKTPEKSSTVSRRMLDSIPWAVTNYNSRTGDCTITRGSPPLAVEDQFTDLLAEAESSNRRLGTTNAFVRDPQVRRRVRERAKGFCEYCSQIGFPMASGAIYIETHHIIFLSEKGADADLNVIALCPNDHRRAHHAVEAEALSLEFQRIVAAKLKLAS